MSRSEKVRNSFLATSIIVAVIISVIGVFGLFRLLGMTGEEEISVGEAFLLLVVILLLFTIGSAVGGWVWVFFGKLFFGLTHDKAYSLFFKNQPYIPIITPYNEWCMKMVFPEEERERRRMDGL
jgi:hypothetical protein